jgi:hypothetical protein
MVEKAEKHALFYTGHQQAEQGLSCLSSTHQRPLIKLL